MAVETTNLGLVKPSGNEAPDIAVINGNMDLLDTEIYNLKNQFEFDSDIIE